MQSCTSWFPLLSPSDRFEESLKYPYSNFDLTVAYRFRGSVEACAQCGNFVLVLEFRFRIRIHYSLGLLLNFEVR